MSTMNLLEETIAALTAHAKTPNDVRFVCTNAAIGEWSDFERYADFNYDAGFGGVEVEPTLKIVGDGWWLERSEYDGSEWWDFKTIPVKRPLAKPLQEKDLRDSY